MRSEFKRKFSLCMYKNLKIKLGEMSFFKDFVNDSRGDPYPVTQKSPDCIEYIKNNFTEQITLDEISKRSTMSKSSFCQLFYKLTGHSFNSYLNLCRIKKSTEYIKNGYKITAIYGLCGYSDFSTFYRNFKKIMGVSPMEFKKNNV